MIRRLSIQPPFVHVLPAFVLPLLALLALPTAARGQDRPTAPAAAKPARENPIEITWRCDPPVVSPGGWVDVVAAYDVAQGYYFAAPRSPQGPAAKLEISGPQDWRRNSSAWMQPGQKLVDPEHGEIVAFGGKAGMRWRYHVPTGIPDAKHEFKLTLTLTLSDGKKGVERKFEGATSVHVHSSGTRGPLLRNLDNTTPLSEEEQALLVKNGFVVRPRAEFGVARSKDVAVVVLDILLEPGVHDDALNIFCEPQERRFIPLPGWRAFHAQVGLAQDTQTTQLREVLPIEFWDDGLAGDVKIPIEVTLRTTREQDKASRMATQSIVLGMRYER
ncbi:MAG: hypothetical protein L6Q99_00875 [Planctomycetes bacterium]|nr:hypothetical protein [Planctomycetota bacterium]